jgi:Mce-associated membrane protein
MDADRPADPPVTPSPTPGPGRLASLWSAPPRWLTATLGVLLAALLATGGVLAWQLREATALADRRTAVLQAATEHVSTFLSIDYRQARRGTEEVLTGAAGEFKRQYAASRARLHELVRQNRTVSTGEVLSAGVVSSDPDSARVIVVADSQVQNVSSPEPQPRHYRLQVDLARQGERWLMTSLEFVG